MRIPHIINPNTLVAYTPSEETRELVGEDLRVVVAEDFNWDKNECPSLAEYCVRAIAKDFEQKQLLDELPCTDRDHFLEVLSEDLPLEIAIPLIDEEYYWMRRYKEKFGLVTDHVPENWQWKTIYIEKHVQHMVENAEPQYGDEETFDEILKLCCPYVERLLVTQLQYWQPPRTMEKEDIPEEFPIEHIYFLPIFSKLKNITEFDLVFGMNDVSEKYDWSMFKVSVPDCQRLGKALLELKHLKIFRLHRSRIEYKHCQALIQGLIKHTSIEELDLSNCEICCGGALCVAKFLQENRSLKTLNLSNNCIAQTGAEGIGFALTNDKNCAPLEILNLKLNPLGNEGTMGILRAVVRSDYPKKLSLGACLFEEDTPLKVCQMIKLNNTLTYLDVSCNWFGNEGGEALIDAIQQNTTLEWIDIRDTDVTDQQAAKIQRLVLKNRVRNHTGEELESEPESTPDAVTFAAEEELIAEINLEEQQQQTETEGNAEEQKEVEEEQTEAVEDE